MKKILSLVLIAIISQSVFAQAEKEEFDHVLGTFTDPRDGQVYNTITFKKKMGDAIILSGDLHSFWAMDGYQVSSAEDQVPAVEFVSSSISANWPPPLSEPISRNLDNNPHVAYYEGSERGYLLHDVDANTWQTRYRAVGDSTSRAAESADALGTEAAGSAHSTAAVLVRLIIPARAAPE